MSKQATTIGNLEQDAKQRQEELLGEIQGGLREMSSALQSQEHLIRDGEGHASAVLTRVAELEAAHVAQDERVCTLAELSSSLCQRQEGMEPLNERVQELETMADSSNDLRQMVEGLAGDLRAASGDILASTRLASSAAKVSPSNVASSSGAVLGIVQVDVGNGVQGSITVHDGDHASALAATCASAHALADAERDAIQAYLEDFLSGGDGGALVEKR